MAVFGGTLRYGITVWEGAYTPLIQGLMVLMALARTNLIFPDKFLKTSIILLSEQANEESSSLSRERAKIFPKINSVFTNVFEKKQEKIQRNSTQK